MTHAPLNFLWMPGRVLFVSYFIALGLSHLIHFEQHALVLKRKEAHDRDDDLWRGNGAV
jgi:hypothetical protein